MTAPTPQGGARARLPWTGWKIINCPPWLLLSAGWSYYGVTCSPDPCSAIQNYWETSFPASSARHGEAGVIIGLLATGWSLGNTPARSAPTGRWLPSNPLPEITPRRCFRRPTFNPQCNVTLDLITTQTRFLNPSSLQILRPGKVTGNQDKNFEIQFIFY